MYVYGRLKDYIINCEERGSVVSVPTLCEPSVRVRVSVCSHCVNSVRVCVRVCLSATVINQLRLKKYSRVLERYRACVIFRKYSRVLDAERVRFLGNTLGRDTECV